MEHIAQSGIALGIGIQVLLALFFAGLSAYLIILCGGRNKDGE